MKTASYPFDLPSGDVMFVTADSVEFRLHKSILSIASPFFSDMFSLTQPSTPQASESSGSRISVTENSEVFDALMRLVYPVAEPPLTDPTRVERVLEAALKYQLEKATSTVRSAFRLLLTQYPLSIFASACRLRLQEEAQMAAVEWKKRVTWNTDPFISDFNATLAGACYGEELATLSAGTYFRLLYFLRTNPNPAVNFIDPGNPITSSSTVEQRKDASPVANPRLQEYSQDTDIILHSRDGVEIRTHRVILRLASAERLLGAKPSSQDGTSVYNVDINSSTLRSLVQLCYPFARIASTSTTLQELDEIVQAAKAYAIGGVVDLVMNHCFEVVPKNPLIVYFYAKKWNWEVLAHAALECVLETQMNSPVDIDTAYNWVMEYTTAAHYMDLLKRIHLSRVAALRLLSQRSRCPRGWKELMGTYGFSVLASLATELHRQPSEEVDALAFLNGCSLCGRYKENSGLFGNVTPGCSCKVCQTPRRSGGLFGACLCPTFGPQCRKYLEDKVSIQTHLRNVLASSK